MANPILDSAEKQNWDDFKKALERRRESYYGKYSRQDKSHVSGKTAFHHICESGTIEAFDAYADSILKSDVSYSDFKNLTSQQDADDKSPLYYLLTRADNEEAVVDMLKKIKSWHYSSKGLVSGAVYTTYSVTDIIDLNPAGMSLLQAAAENSSFHVVNAYYDLCVDQGINFSAGEIIEATTTQIKKIQPEKNDLSTNSAIEIKAFINSVYLASGNKDHLNLVLRQKVMHSAWPKLVNAANTGQVQDMLTDFKTLNGSDFNVIDPKHVFMLVEVLMNNAPKDNPTVYKQAITRIDELLNYLDEKQMLGKGQQSQKLNDLRFNGEADNFEHARAFHAEANNIPMLKQCFDNWRYDIKVKVTTIETLINHARIGTPNYFEHCSDIIEFINHESVRNGLDQKQVAHYTNTLSKKAFDSALSQAPKSAPLVVLPDYKDFLVKNQEYINLPAGSEDQIIEILKTHLNQVEDHELDGTYAKATQLMEDFLKLSKKTEQEKQKYLSSLLERQSQLKALKGKQPADRKVEHNKNYQENRLENETQRKLAEKRKKLGYMQQAYLATQYSVEQTKNAPKNAAGNLAYNQGLRIAADYIPSVVTALVPALEPAQKLGKIGLKTAAKQANLTEKIGLTDDSHGENIVRTVITTGTTTVIGGYGAAAGAAVGTLLAGPIGAAIGGAGGAYLAGQSSKMTTANLIDQFNFYSNKYITTNPESTKSILPIVQVNLVDNDAPVLKKIRDEFNKFDDELGGFFSKLANSLTILEALSEDEILEDKERIKILLRNSEDFLNLIENSEAYKEIRELLESDEFKVDNTKRKSTYIKQCEGSLFTKNTSRMRLLIERVNSLEENYSTNPEASSSSSSSSRKKRK